MWHLTGAIFLWGFSNFFIKLARLRIDAISTLFWETIGFTATALLLVFLRSGFAVSLDKAGAAWATIAAVSLAFGGYFFLLALGSIKLSIAMPFSALNVLVSALLGVWLLRETLTITQMIGVAAMIAGTVLLGTSEGK